jgi:hypothetical protein
VAVWGVDHHDARVRRPWGISVVTAVRIGCGAGYSGDRIEPAVELAEHGQLHYLVFECLAERTMAIAQQAKARSATDGYDALLLDRMAAVLPKCVEGGVRILTNMGAANPVAAAWAVRHLACNLGFNRLKIAAVTGDDVLTDVRAEKYPVEETGLPVSSLGDKLISANAYLGAEPLMEALRGGADIVIAGRVADPSLFLAPLAYEFNWSMDAWPLLGAGTLVGHLLECAGQVTGGYFADPALKNVPHLERLGFPLAEVAEDGTAVITKVPGSGGLVTTATCKEQLLYEIGDPASYPTPDVVADFSGVRVVDVGEDRVRVSGASGAPRPDRLKVSLAYADGFIGEGQISYAGPGAVNRARLAGEIVERRLRLTHAQVAELRIDLIGLNALRGDTPAARSNEPYEVRLRVAGRTTAVNEAVRIGNEVETLYTNGPAGGAGVTKMVRDVLAVASTYIPRDRVEAAVSWEVA